MQRVGHLFYRKVATGREVVVGAAALSLEGFKFGESSSGQQ
jgi:hypothetical protein